MPLSCKRRAPSSPLVPRHADGTHFLSLPDDAMGLIYDNLDYSSKACLRHSCATLFRSPAINSRLQHLVLGSPNEDSFSALAAFPRNASLKSLEISLPPISSQAASSGTSVAPLRMYLSNPIAQARLFDVTDLSLWNCQLAVGDIALMKIHVPKLAKLSMDRCSLPDSFRCELPILVGLQTLCLNPVCSIFQALQPIARLDSLQCLELGFGVTMDVDVSCLSSLRRLETLHVANCKLVNLHFLLNSIPLRNLDLRNVELETGLRYASTTLRNIFVDCISLAFPVLAAQNFPCLSLLSFETIDLSQGVSGIEKKDVIEKAQQFSEWVTKGPFEAVPGEEGGPFGIAAPPGFSAAFYCSLLQELLPLRRMLSKTPFLDLRNWCFCEGGLEVLGKLCGGSSKEGICLGFENVRFLASRPMLRLLRVVPSVRSVLIFNDGVLFDDTLPKDVIASLLAAQHAQRHFCINMHFSVTLDEEAVPVFKFLADQWDSVKTDIITPPVYSTLQLRLFPGNIFTYT